MTYDFNAEMQASHEEREQRFGSKPFTFGFKPRPLDDDGNPVPGDREPETFYVRANVGYLAIKRVAALSDLSSGEETFEAVENAVFSMIDPSGNALERFRSVVTDKEFPITFEDIVKLQNWLMAESTSLPPTEQESSATSPTRNGQSSTADSSTAQEGASTS